MLKMFAGRVGQVMQRILRPALDKITRQHHLTFLDSGKKCIAIKKREWRGRIFSGAQLESRYWENNLNFVYCSNLFSYLSLHHTWTTLPVIRPTYGVTDVINRTYPAHSLAFDLIKKNKTTIQQGFAWLVRIFRHQFTLYFNTIRWCYRFKPSHSHPSITLVKFHSRL